MEIRPQLVEVGLLLTRAMWVREIELKSKRLGSKHTNLPSHLTTPVVI